MSERIIAHLDMDAFFAAVEERDNPQFKGKPIVVGSDPLGGKGRGVVSTANYKAREYGIHSAMPISKAWQLAKKAEKDGKEPTIFLGVNFHRYGEISEEIMAIIRKHVSLIEEAGIDEAYMDLSFIKDFKKAKELCLEIKKEIKKKENLTASVGIGPNKLIAKIASDMQKPDGLTVVEENDVRKFMDPLPIRKIPGIGPKTELIFLKEKIKIVSDLKKLTQKELENKFGVRGIEIYEKARGQDDSPIVEEYEIKSIGEQETFSKDTLSADFIFGRLEVLCKNLIKRFEESDFKGFKTIVITVRFEDFETKTRTHTLEKNEREYKALYFETMKLFLPFLDKRENPKQKLIRLIGVRIEKLS